MKNLRGKLKVHPTRKYSKRKIEEITSIGVHHSLTFQGSPEAFARYHVTHNGWPGIGYTYVIAKDGTIYQCHDLDVKTAHVGNSNRKSLGICLVGDFRSEDPTEEQLKASAWLCKKLITDIPSIEKIQSHSDYPGYDWKECCAFDVMKITNRM